MDQNRSTKESRAIVLLTQNETCFHDAGHHLSAPIGSTALEGGEVVIIKQIIATSEVNVNNQQSEAA